MITTRFRTEKTLAAAQTVSERYRLSGLWADAESLFQKLDATPHWHTWVELTAAESVTLQQMLGALPVGQIPGAFDAYEAVVQANAAQDAFAQAPQVAVCA